MVPCVERLTEEAAKQAEAVDLSPPFALSLAELAAPYSGRHTGFNARFERFLFSIHDGVVERVELLTTNEATEVRELLADAANAIRDLRLCVFDPDLPSTTSHPAAAVRVRRADAVLVRIETYQGIR